jgi:hypothetical protein
MQADAAVRSDRFRAAAVLFAAAGVAFSDRR